MNAQRVTTTPFTDQKPGTSGLRKKVTVFQTPHYLENFVQSVFDCLPDHDGRTLVLGGDGRYYNREAIITIVRMAAANHWGRLLIGAGGILSTPAASGLIRRTGARGGLILSASHNPAGPHEDFGIKFNDANGGPATESLTAKIFARTKELTEYRIADIDDHLLPDIDRPGEYHIGPLTIEIVDPVTGYADQMEQLFDFDAIRAALGAGLRIRFDAMHAVTGPYAREILVNRLGAGSESLVNGKVLDDFGGSHPDPNLTHAHELVALMQSGEYDFGAASDGDGDRNMVLGRDCYINPCDSLAVIAANATLIPGYRGGLKGVARSMPTSRAVDRVAAALDLPCFETPTGWKFFGNLLDAGRITLCGEESFGTGSDHVREKDGLWAVLCWLNILAVTGKAPAELMEEHWQRYGRDYFTRHDYEGLDTQVANALMDDLRASLATLPGNHFGDETVVAADEFSYTDPVDGSISGSQGIRVFFADEGRAVFRLSGTGTSGATLRVYLDRHFDAPGSLAMNPQNALASMIHAVDALTELNKRTGRSRPDVIT